MKKTVSLLIALVLFLTACMGMASAESENKAYRIALSSDLFDAVNGIVLEVGTQKQPQPALSVKLEKNGASLLDVSAMLDSESKALYLTGDVIGGAEVSISADEIAAFAGEAVLSLLNEVKGLIDSGIQKVEGGSLKPFFGEMFDELYRDLQAGNTEGEEEEYLFNLVSAVEKMYVYSLRIMSRATAQPAGDGLTCYTMTVTGEDLKEIFAIEKELLPLDDEMISQALDMYNEGITLSVTAADDLVPVSAIMNYSMKTEDGEAFHVIISAEQTKNDDADSFSFGIVYQDDASGAQMDLFALNGRTDAAGNQDVRMNLAGAYQLILSVTPPTESAEGGMNADLMIAEGEEPISLTVTAEHFTLDGSAVPEISLKMYGMLIATLTVEKISPASEISVNTADAVSLLSVPEEELTGAVMTWFSSAVQAFGAM